MRLDDFLPILVFFIVFKLYGIYWATFALILASVFQLIYIQLRYKKIQGIYWISFWAILIFGSATIFFRDPRFLQWKVSIIYWLMGIAFLGSQILKRTLIEYFMTSNQPVVLSVKIMRILNLIWGTFFIFLATLNIYIAYHFSMSAWVNFKVFGIFGLTIAFIIFQTVYLMYLIKRPQK